MISPALADKGTYVVISGVDIPGMQFVTVDSNVEQYASSFDFPTVGVSGKIYKDKETGRSYVWNGREYTETSTDDSKNLVVIGAPTVKFFKGEPYIVPQRSVLS
jgi:hypothetical protein